MDKLNNNKVSHSIKNLINQRHLLKALVNSNNKTKKAILLNADKKLVEAICVSIFNILQGNLNISESDKKQLEKHKKILRSLVKKSSLKEKKKVLVQKGGFLQFLIPAAISGISSIISSLIEKSNSEDKE